MYPDFLNRIKERANTLVLGDPMDSDVDMGPVISRQQWETVWRYIDIGKKEGARLLLGGGIPELPETADEARAIQAVLKAPHIDAVAVPDSPYKDGCGWINSVRFQKLGGARLGAERAVARPIVQQPAPEGADRNACLFPLRKDSKYSPKATLFCTRGHSPGHRKRRRWR